MSYQSLIEVATRITGRSAGGGEVTIEGHINDDPMPESKPGVDARIDSGTAPFIETYRPKGTSRGDAFYYRLRYRNGNRWQRCHICGGSIHSPSAQRRKKLIEDAIAVGKSIELLLEMCK
jgi:hypothetical protein